MPSGCSLGERDGVCKSEGESDEVFAQELARVSSVINMGDCYMDMSTWYTAFYASLRMEMPFIEIVVITIYSFPHGQ